MTFRVPNLYARKQPSPKAEPVVTLKLPAPYRCFFAEIDNTIGIELKERALGKYPRQVRLLGAAVAVKQDTAINDTCHLQLDDGTGTVEVKVSRALLTSCIKELGVHSSTVPIDAINSAIVGQNFECIARISSRTVQDGVKRRAVVELQVVKIAHVTDPHMPTLRTMEILVQNKRSTPADNIGFDYGDTNTDSSSKTSSQQQLASTMQDLSIYPIINRPDLESSDLHGLVLSMAHAGGVSAQEMCIMYQSKATASEIGELITELQVSGVIYQGNNGKYLPL